VTFGLVASPILAAMMAGAAVPPPELAEGIALYRQGAFEDAVLTLDSSLRSLERDSSKGHSLAVGYLYLGATYVGLRQSALARSKFLAALRADPKLTISADEFPPAVLRLFGEAHQSFVSATTAEKGARRKSGTGGVILLGLGGAAAVGIAVAVTQKGEPANQPPTASISVSPSGDLITGVTVATFTATASDPDPKQTLTLTWSFPDGASVVGSTANHVFGSDGAHTVTLNVSDGRDRVDFRTTVRARSLTGRWSATTPGMYGERDFDLQQTTTTIGGQVQFGDTANVFGSVADPRRVNMHYERLSVTRDFFFRCQIQVQGEVDAAGDTINATLSCSSCSGDPPIEQNCVLRDARPYVLRRQ
jgi:hypothetical protein